MIQAERRLPFDGELISAAQKRFEEKIVFVHQFGGNKKSMHRHVAIVNDLGFDAVIFNLAYFDSLENPNRAILKSPPITADMRFGARHVWQDQIESILNQVPGPKFLFCFSMPANSAFLAVGHRHAKNIRGIICEGGPFLQIPTCLWNLYTHRFKVESKILRGFFTATSMALYGHGLDREAKELLKNLPKDFPVLSFRAGNDALVPAVAVDDFLKQAGAAQIERVNIDNAPHLEALKADPAKYKSHLAHFLSENGTSI